MTTDKMLIGAILSLIGLPVVAFGRLPAQERAGQVPIPIADHHAHLKSPALAALWQVRLLPVTLPAALDRVLKDFERHWHGRNEAAFAELFTADGVMQYGDAWRRGRAAIRISQLDSKAADIKLWAQQFEMHDSLAYIIGSYGHRTLPDLADLGRLHWTLRKDREGVWRIAASMMGNVSAPSPSDTATRPARLLIAQLDSAGMRKAAVLSMAYQFGSPMFEIEDEYAKVRAENDWTAQQVALYPDRLVAFCSFNPTKSYALAELERCMRTPRFTGLKLHFTSSFVDLRNVDQVEQLRRVFRAANRRRCPIVVHMRTLDDGYGRVDAEVFLRQILAEAPDVPVQIAHLAGWAGWGPETEQALAVFAEAIAAGDRRTANVYFDLTAIAPIGPDSIRSAIVQRLRQIGLRRLVFGIDLADNAAQMRERWTRLMEFPFSADERRVISANVAPYMR
jgi:predicted TIM-barrel fold metal-dependent hydrolase